MLIILSMHMFFYNVHQFMFKALGALAKERPDCPIEFVANYLLREKERFASGPSGATN